jgi:Zn finger protein HypA/HybF involved in hydrogenase expression
MHQEFAMLNQIFKKCLEVARSNNIPSISEINLEVGDFALIAEIYAQKAFDLLKKDSIAKNAVLNIKRTPGILHCNSCQQKSVIWVNKEKENAANEGRLEEYEEYEKIIIGESLGNPNLESDIFHCRRCDSSYTNLIEGKGVFIKNIRK